MKTSISWILTLITAITTVANVKELVVIIAGLTSFAYTLLQIYFLIIRKNNKRKSTIE